MTGPLGRSGPQVFCREDGNDLLRPLSKENAGVPGSIPGSPRGLVKFGHVMGKGFHWDLNPGPNDGPVVTDRSKAAQPRSSEKNAARRARQTPCERWAVGICYALY